MSDSHEPSSLLWLMMPDGSGLRGSDRKRIDLEYINKFGVWVPGVEVPFPAGIPKSGEVTRCLDGDELERDFASVPGLFYESVRGDGIPVWRISQEFRLGDPLHCRFLDNFTNEQHWELIKTCKITNVLEHGALLNLLGKINFDYGTYVDIIAERKARAEDRARFVAMAKTAEKLRSFLEQKRLREGILDQVDGKLPYGPGPAMIAGLQYEAVNLVLSTLAERALNKDEALGTLERDLGIEDFNSTKSVERQLIWEPFLNFWAFLGHQVGYTENGPIVRVLRIIHAALGIERPRATSVRQVINDFHRRPRAAKKISG